jgi:hypothetical protein
VYGRRLATQEGLPMTTDHFDDDENVKMMRATAQELGLPALLRDLHQQHLEALERLNANSIRISKVMDLLGVAEEAKS